MLKHRALKSEKGANFCGNHRTDCIIQQLHQNKLFLLYIFFFDFGALCVYEAGMKYIYKYMLFIFIKKNRNFYQ